MEKDCYGIVYKAVNNINKKIYIGKTTNSLDFRKNSHYSFAKQGKNTLFARALRKYNYAFSWNILYAAYTKEELKEAEIAYIWLYMSNNKLFGYNLTEGGEGLKGLVFSEQHKKRIGDAHRGEKNYWHTHPYPEEKKEKQRQKMKGMKFSKAIIEQRANTQRGKKRNKVSGKNNYFYKEVDDSFIIKLHKEGKSVPEIYNITGITKRIIHTRLKWNNLKCNNRFAKKIVDTNKIHYYVQQGLSYKEISNLFNVSETIISKNYRTSEFYQGRRTSWDTIHMRQAKRVPNESIK